MSEHHDEPEGEEELVVTLAAHPKLDVYLTARRWDRAGVGHWRWIPSLAATPEDKWDVTTIMWDGEQVLIGIVGDWLTHMWTRTSVEELAAQIHQLEAMRYEG